MSTMQLFSSIVQQRRLIRGESPRLSFPRFLLLLAVCGLLALAGCANPKPIANAGPDLTVQVNTLVHLDGRASRDSAGALLTYAWSFIAKPAGSTATLSDPTSPEPTFTVDLPGSYVAQLVVNNGKTSSNPDTVTVKVEASVPPNRPPIISSAPVTQATVGQPYTYDVEATDADGDTLSYALVAGPPDMAIDSSTGVITWNPTEAQAGNQPVAVKVQDGKGGSAAQSFAVTVQSVANKVLAPNLVGLSKSTALTQIQQAKLKLGTYTYQHSDTFPDGQVISQNPAANAPVEVGASVDLTVSIGPNNGLPPNPATVAPQIDPTIATTTYAATQFLYSGSNPIQTGVMAGTIEPKRAAVIRGRVLARDNQPLSGVTITILNRPEFGRTITRMDGAFDIAVNGGGYLTINYEKSGFLPAQRQIDVPWQNFAFAPEVVLIAADSRVTPVDLQAPGMKVARGNVQTDADGSRQATLLFPQGTTAEMFMPDGNRQPMTTLTVRATEYTVGLNGPQSMPAELPPNVAYTHAVLFSADEAKAAGATDVIFNQPIPYYVENFLNFPVGTIVPLGAYDSSKGQWVPYDNGRVIKILANSDGLADLDTDGDGQPDDAAKLANLNISDAERQQLASLYAVGQTLWRHRIPHFDKAWDSNWGWAPPNDAVYPESTPQAAADVDDPCPRNYSSDIECQNQILGESIPLTGTSFSLNYRSDRVPGRGRGLDIPLSGALVPASLIRIELEIRIAGQQLRYTVAKGGNIQSLANQHYTFIWDGKDAYGNTPQGPQPVTVRIGYVYYGEYQNTSRFGYNGNGRITASRTRGEITLWQRWQGLVGSWDVRKQGLGAWSLDMHHVYDPVARTLYMGDGSRRNAQNIDPIIRTVAGTGVAGYSGDGGPATRAQLSVNVSTAMDSAGNLFIADQGNNCIRRVGPDGIITTIAGTGQAGYSGDGGPATRAKLWSPFAVAFGPDGSLYFSDTTNNRIRRVGPDGIITTVAGTSVGGYSGDGGPATAARILQPLGLTVGSDGSLYFSDDLARRIRRVGPDGIITTVAYGATLGARVVTSNPDGNLYYTGLNRVIRMGPDGAIATVAGTGPVGFIGDGGPAAKAWLGTPVGLAVGRDGSLYIAGHGGSRFDSVRVRRVGPDGIITTVAGTGTGGYSGDGGPARQAKLMVEGGVTLAHDGGLYTAGGNPGGQVRRISRILPWVTWNDVSIPSEDGSEIFVFNGVGRHLRTLDALSGAIRYRFDYDDKGLLTKVTDGNGNVTTIERNALGNPTAIVAPFGQRTTLVLDAQGYLAKVTNPAGEATQLGYSTNGLLTTFTDPKGAVSRYAYDDRGWLIKDEDPVGAIQSLSRLDSGNGFEVTLTDGMGLGTEYLIEHLATGDERRTNTFPGGFKNQTLNKTDGSYNITFADGTVSNEVQGPDPRFGMQAPVTKSQTIKSPAGLTATLAAERSITLKDSADPLSLTALTETIRVNTRPYTSVFDVASRTYSNTTPAGRKSTSKVDALNRPLEQRYASLAPIQYAYDPQGRLTGVTEGTGAEARTTLFHYNAQGVLDRITDPLAQTLGFEYDLAGRILTETLADGRAVHYEYDPNGNLTSLSPPGRPEHTFAYNAVDLLSEYAPPMLGSEPNRSQYHYNKDRQLSQVLRPDGATVDLEYDGAGRLGSVTQVRGKTAYDYYPTSGLMKSVTTPDGGNLDFTYDGSLLKQQGWQGAVTGTVGYTYDTDFRLASIKVNAGPSWAFQYDADSLLTKAGDLTLTRDQQHGLLTATALGAISDTFSYNSFGELTDYQAQYQNTVLLAIHYAYDKLGRIIQKEETISTLKNTYDYGYDLRSRLQEVKKNGITVASYTYDDNGNRLSGPGLSTPATYDAQDRLLRYGGMTYNYTANGELLTKTGGSQVTRYQYDALGNLVQVTLQDGTRIDYVVDGNNRRIGKKINGTPVQGFLYQGSLTPVAELDGNNQIVSTFVYATHVNVPDYLVKSGATYRIITDHLGSPRLVVDVSTNTVAQRMDYDEFGNVVLDTNPGFQPFGFAGGIYDSDTGLVRFGVRDYDAMVGRWTAKDPVIFSGGINVYGYVRQDPINQVDSTGRRARFSDTYAKQIWTNAKNSNPLVGALLSAMEADPLTIYSFSSRPVNPLDLSAIAKGLGAGFNRRNYAGYAIVFSRQASRAYFCSAFRNDKPIESVIVHEAAEAYYRNLGWATNRAHEMGLWYENLVDQAYDVPGRYFSVMP